MEDRMFATVLYVGMICFVCCLRYQKTMSPHRICHSTITAALDATDGNVRKVQKLSRHRQLDTLMIYNDNRGKDQAQVTGILDDLV